MERRWSIPLICIGLTIALFQVVSADESINTCSPEVILPEDYIQFSVIDGEESYFEVTINNPSGDLDSGPYAGWCVEKGAHMERPNVNHTGTVHSSYDENMPSFFIDDGNKIGMKI